MKLTLTPEPEAMTTSLLLLPDGAVKGEKGTIRLGKEVGMHNKEHCHDIQLYRYVLVNNKYETYIRTSLTCSNTQSHIKLVKPSTLPEHISNAHGNIALCVFNIKIR